MSPELMPFVSLRLPPSILALLGALAPAACGPETPIAEDSTGAATTEPATTQPTTTNAISTTSTTSETTAPNDSGTDGPPPDITGPSPTDLPPSWCNSDLHDLECSSEPQATLIEGMTPLGFVSYPYAFAGVTTCGICIDEPPYWTQVIALDDLAQLPRYPDDLSEGLTILEIFDSEEGVPLLVSVGVHLGGETMGTMGELVFDQIPSQEELGGPDALELAPRWLGTLSVEGDGWSLSGTFEAPACRSSMLAIPCD